jgi:hypothetical protein
MLEGSVSFVQAMRDFFGDHPTNPEIKFIPEMKALTPQDKDDFREMLAGVGYNLAPAAS